MNDAFPRNADPDAGSLVRAGLAHHNAGRMAEAEEAYRRVLDRWPGHPDALHLLGVLAFQLGRLPVAADLMRQGLRASPGNAAIPSNLAAVLRQSGRLEEAAAAGRRALMLDPGSADALNNLANILGDLNRHDGAATALRRLLALKPQLTEPRLQLGRSLLLAGRAEDAVEAFLTLLGMMPLSTPAYTNLGVALRRLGRVDEAEAAYRSALGIAPGDPGALNNLGILLQDGGRFEEAAGCFRQSLAGEPASASTWLNLALAARDEMRVDELVTLARRSIRIDPSLAEAHTALSFGLLMKGEMAEGFAEYEWRSRMADFSSPRRSFPSPEWDGSDPRGRTLLIHDEQGVGDTIMLARYAPLLRARSARVFLECNRQLVRLLSAMPGIDGVVERFGPLPPHDAHISLASIPGRLGTGLYTIPAPAAYLRAEPDLAARWRERLADGGGNGLRIGLVWAGNPEFKADRLRSPGLEAFRPLLDVPGVAVYGLQKGPGRRDLERAGPMPANFVDLGPIIEDFADTAAIMEGLDLVISSCTGPAHLAGALGRPVWTVLPFAPDWRWLEHGVCTPWYPSMRLFRQTRRGDWATVMKRVRDALATLAANRV